MLIYSGTVGSFNRDVENNLIADKLEGLFRTHGLRHNNPSEHRSWANSLAKMNMILHDPEIDTECGVAVEYNIPLTSKRVDFILTGIDEKGHDNAVIVELKQWEKAEQTDKKDLVRTYVREALRDETHPSYQAYAYAMTIKNYNEAIQAADVGLYPCAFLHDYKEIYRSQIENPFYEDAIKAAPVFIGDDYQKFREFIKRYVRKADKNKILYELDNGKIRPSKSLEEALPKMLKGKPEFYLLDEQKVVESSIVNIVEHTMVNSGKSTVIVQGGPGTGKSVVAINLMAELLHGSRGRPSYTTEYVTKNSAPRNVYFAELRGDNYRQGYIKNLFRSSDGFYETRANDIDVLLVDEAHRLRSKSGVFKNKGENQIKEIINAARISVFFIDDDQRVTVGDIGSVKAIEDWAKALGATVYEGPEFVLSAQFRCNGSDGYINFLNNVLGIKETANTDLGDLDYDFRVFSDPVAMREALRKKNQLNNKSRMVAGYCYEWLSRGEPADSPIYDIVLPDGFRAKWNLSNTLTWAIDEKSFDEVGCIHTCQGLDFDYVGVIIGPDLRYEDGRVITDQTRMAKSDRTSGIRTCKDKALADKLIRNTYKTLMSRGMKGCYVYCEDKALADYLVRQIAIAGNKDQPRP